MATNNTVSVIPLKGTNYPTWKVQCQMALMKDGLWAIVNGSEERPTGDANAVAKFNVRWDRALAIIVLSIDPALLYFVGEPTNPIEVWQKLSDQFQKKTWANKLHLRKKLYAMRLKDGETMQEHIKAMTELFNELSVIGDQMNDKDRIVHLLVTALEVSAEVPNMEIVTERLLHEECKLTDGKSSHAQDSEKAMTVKRLVYKGPMCYKCKEFGHI